MTPPAQHPRSSRWWAVSDHYEMAGRSLRHLAAEPDQLVTVTLQPVLTLVLMYFFLGGAIQAGTTENYLDFLIPGVFIVMAGFAAVTTATSVASDLLQGVVDRFRTLPMAKSAVITGHVVADLPRSLIGLAVTIAVGLCMGFRSPAGVGAWAAAIGIVLLVTFTLSWIAAVIGLLGTSLEAVQQVSAVIIVPVFLSDALVPTDTMPAWLRVVAANQPLSQATDCVRALLAGTPLGDHLRLALAELVGITAIAFTASALLFRRRTRR
ncbi:ABC transporter permease [Glycomyces arizonensis]|uniref:ABC transporter permease n=1 Tax=Glycomyces arizonensis TaxID=256035 RepID=UPI0003F8001D|nr:ABC transporter permease [Glycomyces arizonensis]